MSSQRSGVLELAVLGVLHETPLHGYELRKRLNSLLGAFRAFGYGSLYPCLKDLLAKGLIADDDVPAARPGRAGNPLAGRRSKIVYRLTADGKERLEDLLGSVRAGVLGGRRLRRALRVLRPDPGRHPDADSRGPPQPPGRAAGGLPGRGHPEARARGQLHP